MAITIDTFLQEHNWIDINKIPNINTKMLMYQNNLQKFCLF